MFGWFDPKHLGWLARFMERSIIFPIPGKGDFLRQPLYVRDFVRAIERCIQKQPEGQVFDLVGPDEINYVDIIKEIKRIRKLKVFLLHIPFQFFKFLLHVVGLVHPKPPFTAQQLDALSAGDYFKGIDIEKVFDFKPTPFISALKDTWEHPIYSKIALKSTH
jgi:nucleoside-diphosphate-sugar epimerase